MSPAAPIATLENRTLWRTTIDDGPVAIASSPEHVAVVGAAGSCRVYSTDGGMSVAELEIDGGLLGAAFSANGAHLALVGPTGYALWHADDGVLQSFRTGEWSARAVWASDDNANDNANDEAGDKVGIAVGRRVLVCSADGTRLWQTVPAPSTITDLAWIRQGRELVASAYNGVYRYAPHQADPVGHFPYPGSHLAVAVSPNGRWLCTGNQDRSVHIWRVRDSDELEMAGFPDKVARVAFDDSGRWFANNGAPEATVWDFAGKGPSGRAPRLLEAHDSITALAWKPGTNGILATGGSEGQLALWNVERGRPGKPTKPLHTTDLDAPVADLTWTDTRHIVTADRTGAVRLVSVG